MKPALVGQARLFNTRPGVLLCILLIIVLIFFLEVFFVFFVIFILSFGIVIVVIVLVGDPGVLRFRLARQLPPRLELRRLTSTRIA